MLMFFDFNAFKLILPIKFISHCLYFFLFSFLPFTILYLWRFILKSALLYTRKGEREMSGFVGHQKL